MNLGQLSEISRWKLEANEEDSGRYFFRLPEFSELEQGNLCYVIGRKGSGKTAIAAHINQIVSPLKFVSDLSFKSFPFNLLYNQADDRYTAPSQYATVWKYSIYSALAAMMAGNELTAHSVKGSLAKSFSQDFQDVLLESSRRESGRTFSFNLAGVLSAEVGGGKADSSNAIPVPRRVEILESLILDNIDSSEYFILFDELDEDYESILHRDSSRSYFDLMTGLFKAVSEVRRVFKNYKNVRPIVFLRDDIYDLVQNNDKNKWDDLRFDLKWDADKLKSLIAFRIKRAMNVSSTSSDFDSAAKIFFKTDSIRYGTNRRRLRPIANHMLDRTLLRPRDMISYFRECAKIAVARKDTAIGPVIVKDAEEEYSIRFRQELVDELHSIIPDIDKIFAALAVLRKQVFLSDEFSSEIDSSGADLAGLSVEKLLELLFHFSVIGNVPSQHSERIFRYKNPHAKISMKERFAVHPGLMKALEIT
jgi:energy-coupling factor transporter ATP-binding protein EcfA2